MIDFLSGPARPWTALTISASLLFAALIAYAEIDRRVRAWRWRRRERRRAGYVDIRGLR